MPRPLDPTLAPHVVFAALDAPVQRLVMAVHTLYGASWEDCAEDLRRRQAGKPYLYRLRIDLDDALGWVGVLQAYEAARGEPFDSQKLVSETFSTAEGAR